jgi:hypothetical protein
MIDSLLGLVMLMLLTGWMAGMVSVQAMLSSPSRGLGSGEQIDYLAAVKAGGGALVSCADLVEQAKNASSIALLQKLLLAPQLMAREDGRSVADIIKDLGAAGELPYGQPADLEKLLRQATSDDVGALSPVRDRSGQTDWQIQIAQADASGKNVRERLLLCP